METARPFLLPLDIGVVGLLRSDGMKEPELAIPPDLFRGTHHLPRSDRYAVYRMLNHLVTFRDPATGAKISGYVEEVYRDIFTGEVRLTAHGRQYRFKEPVIVRELERELVFVYGDVGKKEVSDAKLFSEMKKEQYHETASDTLRRLAPRRIKETRFSLGDKKPSRRKPFLMRGIPAVMAMAVS